ncbi:MAG: hypothetical protein H6703_15320 [Myxococcales bacterium]|nr:hypothetical protein [Myxococcales bacterium]
MPVWPETSIASRASWADAAGGAAGGGLGDPPAPSGPGHASGRSAATSIASGIQPGGAGRGRDLTCPPARRSAAVASPRQVADDAGALAAARQDRDLGRSARGATPLGGGLGRGARLAGGERAAERGGVDAIAAGVGAEAAVGEAGLFGEEPAGLLDEALAARAVGGRRERALGGGGDALAQRADRRRLGAGSRATAASTAAV